MKVEIFNKEIEIPNFTTRQYEQGINYQFRCFTIHIRCTSRYYEIRPFNEGDYMASVDVDYGIYGIEEAVEINRYSWYTEDRVWQTIFDHIEQYIRAREQDLKAKVLQLGETGENIACLECNSFNSWYVLKKLKGDS